MNRLIFTFLFAIVTSLAVQAAPPRLACETLFTDTSLRNENTSVMITKSTDNYYRNFSVENDPKLVKLMEEKIKADTKRAYNTVEKYEGKNEYRVILNINNEGYTINIGFTRYSDSEAKLFVQGEMAAFE
ncbi:MAG: hypothetical protein J6A20_07100 [Muribaculaceae bacterium]|nr:hypothetical protein [Muribaculaceae bacterium]